MFAGARSRHFRAGISTAAQLSARSSRQLSSFAVNRTPPLRLRNSGPGAVPPAGKNPLPSVALPIGAVRFSSSTPQQQPSEATAETNGDALGISNPVDLHDVPEQMGYLKTLGLDYGFGPSSMIESILEAIHIYGQVPWWGSTLILALMTRIVLAKFLMDGSENAAKLKHLTPQTDSLKNRLSAYQKAGDHAGVQSVLKERSNLMRSNGISTVKSFFPLIQLPIAFASFRVIRGMAALPVPSLSLESVGWLSDLTAGDPFYILPVLSAAMVRLALSRSVKTGLTKLPENPAVQQLMLNILPATTVFFMATCPGILQIYFAASGALHLFQNYLMSWSPFRNAVGLSPLPPVPDSTNEPPSDPNAGFVKRQMDKFKSNYKGMQDFLAKSMDGITGPGSNPEPKPPSPYEKRRMEEAASQRELRNQRRREAHMKRMQESQNEVH